MKLKGYFANNENDRRYTEDDFMSYTVANEKFYNMNASMTYIKKMKQGNSLTAKFNHFHKISDVEYTGDYTINQDLWSGESILFLNYTHNIGNRARLMLEPGVSLLQYKLKGEERYVRYFPRFHSSLSYMLAEQQQISFMFNIGSSSPEIYSLNNVSQNIDFVQIRRGNPNLNNMLIYNSAIVYGIFSKKISTTLFGVYNYYKDLNAINYFVEDNKMISSFSSDNNFHEISVVASVAYSPLKTLKFKGELGGIRTVNTGTSNLSQNNLKGRLDINYLLDDFIFNGFLKSPAQRLEIGLINSYQSLDYGFSIGWNHESWSIEAGVNNPFTKNRELREEINFPAYSSVNTQYSRNNQQYGYLKLFYTFGFGKKVSKTKESVDTKIGSGVIKIE